MKSLFLSFILLPAGGAFLHARTFTDQSGRTLEAHFIGATDSEVVVKLLRNGKVRRLKIATLSAMDVEYVAAKRAARQVVEFALKNKGRKVGDGECWTLADEAFKAANIKRPGKDWRIWGGVVDWKKEDALPGDILELRAVKFSNGQHSGPKHTAVVVKKSLRRGEVMVAHQNWGIPGKKVSVLMLRLNQLEEGEAVIYRYGKK